MNIRDEIFALLDSLKCEYTVACGIVTVIGPDGKLWDFTEPSEIKETPYHSWPDTIPAPKTTVPVESKDSIPELLDWDEEDEALAQG